MRSCIKTKDVCSIWPAFSVSRLDDDFIFSGRFQSIKDKITGVRKRISNHGVIIWIFAFSLRDLGNDICPFRWFSPFIWWLSVKITRAFIAFSMGLGCSSGSILLNGMIKRLQWKQKVYISTKVFERQKIPRLFNI